MSVELQGIPDATDNCDNDPGPPSLNGCPISPSDINVIGTDPTCPGKTGGIEVVNNSTVTMTYVIDGVNTNFSATGPITSGNTITENTLNPDTYWVAITIDGIEVYRARLNIVDPSTADIFRYATTTVVAGRTISFQLKPGLTYCQVPDYTKLESIRIYNSVGQIIEAIPYKDEFTIPGSSAGFHLLQVIDVDGNYSNHKILLR